MLTRGPFGGPGRAAPLVLFLPAPSSHLKPQAKWVPTCASPHQLTPTTKEKSTAKRVSVYACLSILRKPWFHKKKTFEKLVINLFESLLVHFSPRNTEKFCRTDVVLDNI